jgi:hypothetical protein
MHTSVQWLYLSRSNNSDDNLNLFQLSVMKVQIHFFIFFFLFKETFCGVEKFKSVFCNSSNETIFMNYTCFLKAVSRDVSTMNIRVHLRKPLYKIYFDYEVFYQRLSVYKRQVISVKKTEICSVVNGTNTNILFSWLVGLVQSSLPPGIYHPCPYEVKI